MAIFDWAYWTDPDTITAYSTFLLTLVTGALVLATWKYVKEVRGQAGDMKKQADAMKEQAEAMKSQARTMDGQSGFIHEQANAMTRQADTLEGQSNLVREQATAMQSQANTMLEQADAMKKQAEILEKQSNIMLENIEYDRLIKKYERVNREMTQLIARLYSRRSDASLFQLQKHNEKFKAAGYNQFNEQHFYFVDFWESIEQNMYLNRSSDFQFDYHNYMVTIDGYFDANDRGESNDTKKKIEDIFYKSNKPNFIRAIEKRYTELSDELKEIESELKICDERRKKK
jgi:hypothetical protein